MKTNERLSIGSDEELNQLTKWIFYGEIDNTKRDLLTMPETSIPKKYDVFYLFLDLKEEEPDLEKGGGIIKRQVSIKKLCDQELHVDVSKRLPKETYENKGFYKA